MSRLAERVGLVLGGRYRLLAPIGTGASASVYLADDTVLRRRVAVKILHAALADDEAFLRRFRAEAQAAAALNHPHVVAVYDWGQDAGADRVGGAGAPVAWADSTPDPAAGIPYLVTEYLGGGSLRAMLDQGSRLSPAQALLVGLETARGLEYAHRRGFVHRDIKPANLLFDEDARLRIADFGLARALAEAAWTEPMGAVLGTARYASPEQARGESLDVKSDVYSLALVVVEAVTGRVPFAADTTIGTLMARVNQPLPVPDDLGALRDPLRWAGNPDPRSRPDAAEFGAALMAAASGFDRPAPLPLAGAKGLRDLAGLGPDPTAHPPSIDLRDAGPAAVAAHGPDLDAGPDQDPATRAPSAPWVGGSMLIAPGATGAHLAVPAAPPDAPFDAVTRTDAPDDQAEDQAVARAVAQAEDQTADQVAAAEDQTADQVAAAEDAAEPGTDPPAAPRRRRPRVSHLLPMTAGAARGVGPDEDRPDLTPTATTAAAPTATTPTAATAVAAAATAAPAAWDIPTAAVVTSGGPSGSGAAADWSSDPGPGPAHWIGPPTMASPAAMPTGATASATATTAQTNPDPATAVAHAQPGWDRHVVVDAPEADDDLDPAPRRGRAARAERQAERRQQRYEQRATRPPRRRWPAVLIALFLVAGATAGGYAYWYTEIRIPYHPMPALVGKNIAELDNQVGSFGWQVTRETRFDDGAPLGQILAQAPGPGTEVARGATIAVVTSNGPPPVEVPTSVVGQTLEEATATLGGVGLGVGDVTRTFDEEAPVGTVLALAKGTPAQVTKGGDVALVVSSGPEPRTIPDGLVGKPVDQATATLKGLGLTVKTSEDFSDAIAKGNVISVTPGVGAQAEKGSSVQLVVSKGPPLVAVPDVKGLSVDDAAAKLEAAGFTVSDVKGSPRKDVTSTDPPAGTMVKPGSDIVLTTSKVDSLIPGLG